MRKAIRNEVPERVCVCVCLIPMLFARPVAHRYRLPVGVVATYIVGSNRVPQASPRLRVCVFLCSGFDGFSLGNRLNAT